MGSQTLASAVQFSMIERLTIERDVIEQGVDPSLELACRRFQVRFAPAAGCRNRVPNPHFQPDQTRHVAPHSKGSVAVEDGDWQKRSS